ncbi:hypothetical protein O3M35_007478 [Rhynocoris fuscipes]|uniref:Uncharacterized protein n=1 Tax=Rhynocoris fuscipes TaxID=488301 RepID=A0AAW1D9R1_9HEMI
MPLPLELSDSSSTTVPEHFKILIENLLIERKQFKDNYKILPKFLKLDYELIYCVAITVALETGFRLGNTLSTFGFDIRAMRELNSFERFRDIDGERLKATLNLPYFPSWTLRIISIPLIGDLALYDILAVEEDEVKFSSSVAVSCSKYLTLLNKDVIS